MNPQPREPGQEPKLIDIKLTGIFISMAGKNISESCHRDLEVTIQVARISHGLSVPKMSMKLAEAFEEWVKAPNNKFGNARARAVAGIALCYAATGQEMFSVPLWKVIQLAGADKGADQRVEMLKLFKVHGFQIANHPDEYWGPRVWQPTI